MKYTKELLEEAARNSTSIAGVLRYLGLRQAGGTQSHIKRRLLAYEIDTSHFKRRAHNKGKPSPRRLRPHQVLVRRPKGSSRVGAATLRRAMVSSDVEYLCATCGVSEIWQEKPLTLHVDHRNGDILDCRLDNLRFLCPNCHSQTWNFAGRGKNTWEPLRDSAERRRRDRLILETAVQNPHIGPKRIVKSIGESCATTVTTVLNRYHIRSRAERQRAGREAIWRYGRAETWALPTISTFLGALKATTNSRSNQHISIANSAETRIANPDPSW